MTDQDQPVEANDVPVVIYVPGLGSAVANNADRVADVVARAADVLDKGRFDTRTSSEVAAPRGLTVGKTVVDGELLDLGLDQRAIRAFSSSSTTTSSAV